MLKRSGFADEGDALFDLLQHFDSGDGESEELVPQHVDDQNVHQFNRKVKISVVRIPPREAGERDDFALVSYGNWQTERKEKREPEDDGEKHYNSCQYVTHVIWAAISFLSCMSDPVTVE